MNAAALAQAAEHFDTVFQGQGYEAWRDRKLALRRTDPDSLMVTLRDPHSLRGCERQALVERCAAHNLAFYALARPEMASASAVFALAAQLGLRRIDRTLGTGPWESRRSRQMCPARPAASFPIRTGR